VEKTSCFLHAAAPGVLPRSADDPHPRRPHCTVGASKHKPLANRFFVGESELSFDSLSCAQIGRDFRAPRSDAAAQRCRDAASRSGP
jgi:hypothetical protein